jgi:membrane protein YdbS with pleckstrin-like domain
MTTLHLVGKIEPEQPVLWKAFPSWTHFIWLYLLSAISLLRGALFFRFGVAGWEAWVTGAAVLLALAAILRHWVHYELTRNRLAVQNDYTGREIQSILLMDVEQVVVQQGAVARFFGIGTVLVRVRSNDRWLSLKGVSEPEELKIRIEALSWKQRLLGARQTPCGL